MTVDPIHQSWFDPLPLQQYQELVKKSAPESVSSCPPDRTVGKPAVSVACGPNLRFLGCLENGTNNYRGTILLVLRDSENSEKTKPTIKYYVGPATTDVSLSLQSGVFPGTLFYQEQGFSFWRFAMDLELTQYEQKVKYSVNDEFNENFQFFLPSIEQ
ncbi:hypothetical protein WICPIJ_006879, partial [Wickerhamomyces pijperi]